MSKKIFKKLLLFSLCFLITERLCHLKTHGFTPSKLPSNLTYNPELDLPCLLKEEELDFILTQPFSFLGSGSQSYAFESKDQKYVLKFIKQSRKRSIPWLEPYRNFTFIDTYLKKRRKREINVLKSTHLAAALLNEETGILFAHLTPKIERKIVLKDNLGIRHTVDLNRCQFVIQKRATLIKGPLSLDQIDQLCALIKTQCNKHIANLDCVIERNFGFLEDRAIVIDLGSFLYKDELKKRAYREQEIFLESLPLRHYLQKNNPE